VPTAASTAHPSLLLELSGQIARALTGEHPAEAVEVAPFTALGALAEPSHVAVSSAMVSTTGRPALGVRFTSEHADAGASARPTEDA